MKKKCVICERVTQYDDDECEICHASYCWYHNKVEDGLCPVCRHNNVV